VQERAEAFLAQFEVRDAQPASGGGPIQPHAIP
jgi:hypothetical protein